jgi:tape measure domain-containing protein
MAVVEERVVEMKFNNAQFQQSVQATLNSMNALNKSLQMQGAAQGLNNLSSAAKNVNLNHISSAVETISNRFRAMGVVATTALATITHQAVAAGNRMIKALTIDSVTKGFREYETQMNAIQTILANTAHAGTNLKQVNAALQELNTYSDQTIYNFSEMAKNIGTFTAAGVSLKDATAAIKGIANLAAVSGSNSQQASAAMYQLSQALAAGKVSLEDWNSVVNAGMGGKVFQDALMETARVHGVAIDQMLKEEGSFRLTLQKGWLTSDILNETLMKFTGDLNAAQLKSMGYNQKQIAQIMKMGKIAKDAATEVKTMTQLFDTLQEAAGSGWSTTWRILIGDFEEAKTLWTSVSNVLGGFVQRSADARNKVLSDWKQLGGRTVLIQAISNAFNGLMSVLKPIKDAFRQIFPATTGKQLYDLTVTIRDFTENLKIGGETADRLKRTFAGVFAVFGIGWDIVKELARTLFGLFGTASEGSGGFLKVTASIGDFLVKVREALHKGDALKKFFQVLGGILAFPIKILQNLGNVIGWVFDRFNGDGASKAASNVSSKFEPMAKLGDVISNVWSKVVSVLEGVWEKFGPIADKLSEFFSGLGEKIDSALQGLNIQDVLSGINTGIFAGLVLMLRNLIGGGGAGGLLGNVNDAIEGFTGSLNAMQNTLRAATLLQIAAAIGILAIAMNVLSKIDSGGLTRAGAAIAVLFGQLLTALLIYEKFSGFVGFAKMPFIAASMILLAIAVNILALAVKQLADLSWSELARGLTGTIVLLGGLIATVSLMPKGPGLIATGLGLIVLAVAVKILASAVEDFAELSWSEIARGLVALAGSLAIVGLALAAIPKTAILSGAGILVVAISLGMVANALQKMGDMSWGEIAKGLVAMFVSLTIIAAALYVIPPTAALSAAGILVTAMSMGMIADALKKMGDMSWGEIAKGLVAMLGSLAIITAALYILPPTALISAGAILITAISLGMVAEALQKLSQMSWGEIAKGLVALAGALTIIALGVTLMIVALPGAAALLVVAAALTVLSPILEKFSEMSWGEIAKGLTMLAGTFLVLGVAGLLLTPVVGTLLLLGTAITLIGVGVLATGAGVLLFATALTALAAAGGAAALALVAMISGVAGTIPLVFRKIGEGIVEFANVIKNGAPAIVGAIVAVLLALINAIEKLIPKIVNTLYKMLSKMLDTMFKYMPKMVDSGLKLVTGILNGIAKNADRLTTAATNVVVNFLNGISRNLPRVIQAGVNLIIKFVNGVADAIRRNSSAMGAAGANLGTAIIEGMIRGMGGGIGAITAKARDLARSALNAAKNALGINSPSKEFIKVGQSVNEGFLKGLKSGDKSQVDKVFNDMKSQISNLMKSSAQDAREAEAAIKKLYKARVFDSQALARAKAKLVQARKENKASTAAYAELTKKLNDEKSTLGKLSTQYDQFTEKIKAANQVLEDAKKTRDDYAKSVKEQYAKLPEITGESKLADYVADIRKQIADTQAFATAIQKLRAFGLNDTMYKDLLARGPGALPFITDVLAAGKDGVNELNKLGSQLDTVAGSLGTKASLNLYQAGVDAAAGIVKGLENQQKAIQNQMDKIADAMVKSIKKKLGIKSPSKEFAKIGGYSAEGLRKGLEQSTHHIEKTAGDVGAKALNALRESLAMMSDILAGDVDMQPMIRPVLDLTNIKKNAGQLDGIFSGTPVTVDGVYSRATSVSSSIRANRSVDSAAQTSSSQADMVFNQYNYSPKELSAAELYRQTKNQLSVAKGALASK